MLAERVKTIASHYVNHEDKERYTKAADRFRLPYVVILVLKSMSNPLVKVLGLGFGGPPSCDRR